jgi:hypothetical protein
MDLDDNTADGILRAVSTAIRQNIQTSGTGCNVQLTRSGDVHISSDGINNVDSALIMGTICRAYGYVHQIPSITFCGGTQDVGGCAPIGYACVIVAAGSQSNQNAVWAHEYGHTKSLEHRPDAGALMNPNPTSGHFALNPSECAALAAPLPTEKWITVPDDLSILVTQSYVRQATSSLKEFVHRNSSGQFDFSLAMQYGPSVLPKLREMLNSPEEKPNAPTIIKMLGLLGDDDTVSLLKDYVRAGPGEITPLEYRAKMAAIISIGYLANRHYAQRPHDNGGPAIEFLTSLTKPADVQRLAGEWTLKGQGRRDRDAALIRTGIRALGISGTPPAKSRLEELLANQSILYDIESNHVNLNEVIQTSIEENEAVHRLGLVRYYQTK